MPNPATGNGGSDPAMLPLPPGAGVTVGDGSVAEGWSGMVPDVSDPDAAAAADGDVAVKFYLPRDESAGAAAGASPGPRIVTRVTVPALWFAEIAAQFADQLEVVLAKGAVPQAAVDAWRETCRKRGEGRITQFIVPALCFALMAVQIEEELNALVANGAVPKSAVDELRAAARRRRNAEPS